MTTKENLFLITGATGNSGTPTVKLMRDAGHRVRALVHDSDERSKRLEELGAEVAAGDFLDFDAVSSATAGVTAAYFCYPIHPGGLLQAQGATRFWCSTSAMSPRTTGTASSPAPTTSSRSSAAANR